MQAHYAERFERDMGTTESEWLMRLPQAIGTWPWQQDGAQQLRVDLGAGHLRLCWQELPPRVIALMRMPRLSVRFAFEGVQEEVRQQFMRRFDLTMQRGGG